MKALRCFALLFCLVPLCFFSGALQAASTAPVAAPAKAASKVTAGKASTRPAKAAVRKKAKPVARSKRKAVSKAVAKPVPKAKLDLSLPTHLVDKLEPEVNTLSSQRRKPLLPSMFPENPPADDSPFQLNGRLINNEMQLQLRNDSRREVEGAAIDFQFRQ
ncbi:hypothetical protein ACQJ0O_19975 [Pseudomonas shirazensis]|uniref:Translation initiation factor 2 n=1 Tax=Pseudomonas putida TaxID=303 RepID=A0A2S3WJ41_PSEPU|nr:hypothetical protein [Pseudomonas putida]POF90984.1 hypothetical protein BGP80_11790 [Pseudomonas putida]